MGRILTTSEPQPDAYQHAITNARISIPHVRNAGDTAMEIDKSQTQVKYEVVTYNPAGKIISIVPRIVMFTDWPANFIADMKAVYAKLEIDAESVGLFYGPGTDEPLE